MPATHRSHIASILKHADSEEVQFVALTFHSGDAIAVHGFNSATLTLERVVHSNLAFSFAHYFDDFALAALMVIGLGCKHPKERGIDSDPAILNKHGSVTDTIALGTWLHVSS